MRRLLWRLLAIAALILGLIGIVLPGLPTVPFVILAAWAGGHGWPALEAWLLAHPRWGPVVRDWRVRGAMPRRAKWLSSLMMAASALILVFSPAPLAVKLGVPATMCAVAVWIWRRPEA